MRIGLATVRGVHFGAQVGAIIAVGALFMGVALPFAPMGIGSLVGMIAQAAGGILVGGLAGGATFGVTHAIVHAIPGGPRFFGDAPPRNPNRIAGSARTRKSASGFFQENNRLEETDGRNVGFRRMIEEQQQLEQMNDFGR